MSGRTLIALAAALAAAGCARCGGGEPAAAPGPKPVAVVNGEPIGATDLARELREARAGDGDGEGPEQRAALLRRVLDELVDRTLLLQEARARSVVVGQDQIERAFLRVRAEYPGTHFDDLLAQQRLSQAELKTRLGHQLTVEKLFEQEVFPRVEVVEAEIERHYADHAQEFEEPEAVRVQQIVVASREEAAQLREKLRRAPKTFAEVARKSSIAPEGKAGGDLGFIGRGSGFPEVFDVAFGLATNQISDVTPSPYGFHLFRVVEKRPAQKRTLDAARGEIAEKLRRHKRARAQEEYVRTLRERAKIQIDDKALASVTP